MQKIEIFDPPMCCSTGICGPSVDPILVRFAADLDWLKAKGVTVERYNLAQQPGMFAQNELVREHLAREGNDCLPLIIIAGTVASKGAYPDRRTLAGLVGVGVTARDLKEGMPREIPTLKNISCCPPGADK